VAHVAVENSYSNKRIVANSVACTSEKERESKRTVVKRPRRREVWIALYLLPVIKKIVAS
jgi:hypothetical protein